MAFVVSSCASGGSIEIDPRWVSVWAVVVSASYASVYFSFLRHVENAAPRSGVDVRDLLAEVGHRNARRRPEDMIVDMAVDSASRHLGIAASTR